MFHFLWHYSDMAALAVLGCEKELSPSSSYCLFLSTAYCLNFINKIFVQLIKNEIIAEKWQSHPLLSMIQDS